MKIWRSLYLRSAKVSDALLFVFWVGLITGMSLGLTFAMFWAFKFGWVGLGT
jgi:hypothetical protein